ncbi:MAG: hypothetical protein RLZZ511_2654 [Cyanobacteriota bacterium]|jgi:hypothetical protein
MIYLILLWTILLVLTQAIGLGWLAQLSIGADWRRGDRLIVAHWLGVILLAVLALALALVQPLTGRMAWVLIGLGLVVAGRSGLRSQWQLWRSWRRADWGLAIAGIAGMAAVMSRAVTWHDAGYYHASVIRWMTEYGVVPGIALLFSNLGFTSSWFAFVAPWTGPALAQTTVLGNGLVALLLLGQWAIVMRRLLQGHGQMPDTFMAIFSSGALAASLMVEPFAAIARSPSPDFPVLALVGVLAWVLLLITQPQPALTVPETAPKQAALLPLTLAAGAVGIKLTALPLLAVGLGFWLWQGQLWQGGRSGRNLLTGFALLVALLGPNLLASITMSGCPLYPSAALCLDLPWSPTTQAVAKIAAGTHNWVSWQGTPPPGMHPWLWALLQVMKNPKDGLIFGAIGLGLATAIAGLWSQRRSIRLRQLPGEVWVTVLGGIGVGFLLVTSVFTRFLLPYLLLFAALIGAWIGAWIGSRTDQPPLLALRRWIAGRGLSLGLSAWATAVMLVNLVQAQGTNGWLPLPLPQSTIVQKVTNRIIYSAPASGDLHIGDGSPYKAEDLDRCWAAALPCSYNIPADVEFRDPKRGIAGGFVRRRVSADAQPAG